MPWKQRTECSCCGEEFKMHDKEKRCRFEQPGWLPISHFNLPELQDPVMGRRDKEVFIAVRKEDWHARDFYKQGDAYMWAIPQERDGTRSYLVVSGLTHWRPLTNKEARAPRIDNRSRLSRK